MASRSTARKVARLCCNNSSRWARKSKRGRGPPASSAPVAIIESRDHGLARARGGNHQVAITSLQETLGLQAIEDLLLEAIRTQIEEDRLFWGRVAGAFLGESGLEVRPIRQVVDGELGVVPVSLKRRGHAVPEVRRLVLADLDVPFQAVGQGGVRDVGRADVGATEAGVAMDQVGLGVQAGAMGIVGNADSGVRQLLQHVDGLQVGGAKVAGGDDAKLGAGPVGERSQRSLPGCGCRPT